MLIFGTVGAATGLPAFRAILSMINCYGPGKAGDPAEIMTASQHRPCVTRRIHVSHFNLTVAISETEPHRGKLAKEKLVLPSVYRRVC
jgi:hydroxymethylglutaryl-CoA reductase